MATMTDPAEIARKLSPAERGILTDEGDWTDEAGLSLVLNGLAVPTLLELTDLGRAVAALLAQTDTGGRDAG